jgi:hypothetical protein
MKNVEPKQSHHMPWRRLGGEKLLLILDLGSRWGEWSALLPCRALPPGKGPPVPIVQEAAWVSEPLWTQKLEEKSFRLYRGSNLDHPVVHPVARLTELPGTHKCTALGQH